MQIGTEEARKLFDDLKTRGIERIEEMKDQAEEETLWLEFKTIAGQKGPLNKEQLGKYSAEMSGFANADGGVIVWGVDCNQRGNDPDEVKELQPFKELKQTINQLKRVSSGYLAPGLNGTEHHPIEIGNDEGYIASYIPRWDGFEPQMACGPKTHHYYCRVHSKCLPMEHYQVADRFRARPHPQLELTWKVHSPDKREAVWTFHLELSLSNTGRGIAMFAACALGRGQPRPNSVNGIYPFSQVGESRPLGREGWWQLIGVGADTVIYPNVSIKFVDIRFETNFSEDLEFDYELFCDGFNQSGLVSIPAEELQREIMSLFWSNRKV